MRQKATGHRLCDPSDLWCSPRLHPWPLVVVHIHASAVSHHKEIQYPVPLQCIWHTHFCSVKNQRRSILMYFNHLLSCLSDIKCWMSQNLVQLNDSKSEIILFGPPKSVTILQNHLGLQSANVKPAAKNLVMMFDIDLSFDKQITSIVQSSFYQLRSISKIRSFLLAQSWEGHPCFYFFTVRLLQLIVFRIVPKSHLTDSAHAKHSCSALNKH